jgi:malate dehydrogenase (oxaloacetate-decarboxylating)
VTRARTVSDGMLLAAADAVAGFVDASELGAAIMPPIDRVRDVSVCVAVAVAQVAVAEGLARADLVDIAGEVRRAMWEPLYREVRSGDSVQSPGCVRR